MKSFELIPYLFLSLPLLVGCSSFSRKATYPKELDYSEHYIESRVESTYGVTFVADGDTLHGILDTGADMTVVAGKQYQDRTDLLPKIHLRNAHDSIMHWHELELQDFIWEDVHFQGLRVAVDDGGNLAGGISPIIGRDVLSGSIVQFDHESNLVKLSRNEAKLKARGQEIPARFDERDKVFVPITLPNGETLEFFLDTGFGGELRLGSKAYKGNYTFREPLVWKELETSGKPKGGRLSLCNVTFGGKVYRNSRIALSNTEKNLLGVHFLKRFKSVTIDYIKKKLYVEYPEKYTLPGIGDIDFQKDTIEAAPLEYIASILQDYNTYGFEVERRGSLLVVTHVEATLEQEGIQLGDTLVGINNLLFDDKYLEELRMRAKVDLCLDQRVQDVELHYALVQSNKVTAYFLKHGRPRALHLSRRQYLQHVPIFGYTYSPNPIKLTGISLMLYADIAARKLSVHIPWGPLIGGHIVEISGTDDKGNVVPLSNRPTKGMK